MNCKEKAGNKLERSSKAVSVTRSNMELDSVTTPQVIFKYTIAFKYATERCLVM